MEKQEAWKRVGDFLGLPFLGYPTSYELPDDNGEVVQFEIETIWLARIRYFYTPDHVIVSVIKADKWTKGVLLMPPQRPIGGQENDDTRSYIGQGVIKPLMLTDWDDPVEKALRHVNIFHNDKGLMYGRGLYTYTLTTRTSSLECDLTYSGFAEEPYLKNLWVSLAETIYHFVELYADDEMRAIIDQKPRVRWWR